MRKRLKKRFEKGRGLFEGDWSNLLSIIFEVDQSDLLLTL